MGYDARRGCVICAWRATCAKKFSVGEGGLHCPDFTEDVELRRKESDAAANKTEQKDSP